MYAGATMPANSDTSHQKASSTDANVQEDLLYELKSNCKEIMYRYACFVSRLCTGVKESGVSVDDFRTFLLKLPAFLNDDEQQGRLLSQVELKRQTRLTNSLMCLVMRAHPS